MTALIIGGAGFIGAALLRRRRKLRTREAFEI